MSLTPSASPAGVLPAHPARGLRGRAGAARRRLLVAAGDAAGAGHQRAGRRARRAGGGAGGAGRRLRRGRRRRPRAGRGRWPTGRPGRRRSWTGCEAAAPGAGASASVRGSPAPAGPGGAGLAARPGGRGRRRRTPRPAWTSRAPGRRCSDRSPRGCAARTEDWRDRAMADDKAPAPSTSAPRTPRCSDALAAEHAAVWGYGVVGAALDERRPAAGRGRRGGPPRRARPGQSRCWPDARPTSSTPRARTRCRSRCCPRSTPPHWGRPGGRRRRGVGAGAGPGGRAVTRELAVGVLSAAEVRAVGWRVAAGQTPVTTRRSRACPTSKDPAPHPRSSSGPRTGPSQAAEERVGDGDRRAAGLTALDQDGEGDVALRAAQLVAHEPAVRVRRGLAAELGGARLAVHLAAAGQRLRRPGRARPRASSAAARRAPLAGPRRRRPRGLGAHDLHRGGRRAAGDARGDQRQLRRAHQHLALPDRVGRLVVPVLVAGTAPLKMPTGSFQSVPTP